MRKSSFVVAVSFACVSPAIAQVAPPSDQAAKAESVEPAERKICRRDEAVGSRLNRKICLTRAQWAGKAKSENDDRSGAHEAAGEAEPL